jgi:hypothetical protein
MQWGANNKIVNCLCKIIQVWWIEQIHSNGSCTYFIAKQKHTIKLLLQHKPHRHGIHSGSVQVCFHLVTIFSKNPHGGMDIFNKIGCWHQSLLLKIQFTNRLISQMCWVFNPPTYPLLKFKNTNRNLCCWIIPLSFNPCTIHLKFSFGWGMYPLPTKINVGKSIVKWTTPTFCSFQKGNDLKLEIEMACNGCTKVMV